MNSNSSRKAHWYPLPAQLLEAIRMAGKSSGQRFAAIRAGVVVQAVALDVVPIAHDEGRLAVRAMRGAALGVVDVAGVHMLQAASLGNLAGALHGLRRRGGAVAEFEIGVEGGEVQGHIGA